MKTANEVMILLFQSQIDSLVYENANHSICIKRLETIASKFPIGSYDYNIVKAAIDELKSKEIDNTQKVLGLSDMLGDVKKDGEKSEKNH